MSDMDMRVGPYTVTIDYDEAGSDWSPIEDPETSACVMTAHQNYDSTNIALTDYGMFKAYGETYIYDPDKNEERAITSWQDVSDHLRTRYGAEVMNIRMYEHSGIALSASPAAHEYWFHDQWDSGQYGVVFLTRDQIAEINGAQRVTKKMRAKARELMAAIIKEYGEYMNGSVFYYTIKDEHGEVIDSCGGFIGYEYVEQQALTSARYELERNIVRPRTFVGEVREGIPAVTTPTGGDRSFDQQIVRLDDGLGRTLASVRIIRDGKSRGKWYATADGVDREREIILLPRGTREACVEAAREHFLRIYMGEAPDYYGRLAVHGEEVQESDVA